MIVRSEEKNVLDAGAIPATSTKSDSYYYSENEWNKMVGWGSVPDYRTKGVTSFDRAKSTQADDPTGD